MTCQGPRHQELVDQGWTRQFWAQEPRLGEAVELYREAGFQVLLEPLDPAACRREGGCTACFQAPEVAARFKIIYTRPPTKG
jgi:hypothetical protein